MAHRALAIALASIGIATVGFATIFVALPSFSGTQTTISMSTSASGSTTTLSSTSFASGTNPYSCPKTEIIGNLTWTYNPCERFPPDFYSAWQSQAYDILDSPQVQASINGAYDYHLVYFKQSASDPSRAQVILNVTGSQVVNGSWSMGYQLSYVGNVILNVTTAQVSSTFEVTHLSVYHVPDRQASLSFSAQQQKAIAAATSDPKTESLMTGEPYYVVWVSPFEGNEYFVGPQCPGYNGNSSVVVNSYDVQFDQVNGYRNIQVYLDQRFNVVARVTSDQPRSTEGVPGSGFSITDPWISDYVAPQQGFSSCPQ